jgi:tetrahydromethanopterin S-methyltransferase subunit G
MTDLGRFIWGSIRRRLEDLEDDVHETEYLEKPISTEEERAAVLRRLERLERQVSIIRGEDS